MFFSTSPICSKKTLSHSREHSMTFFPFDENLYTTDSRVNSIKIYGFFEKAKFGLRQYSLVSHSPFLVSYVQYLLVFAISSGYTSWLYCILQSWLYLLYFCILLGYVQYFSSLFYTLQSLLYLLDILIGCIVPYSFGYVLYLLVFAILFGYVQYPKVFAILLDILSVLCPEPSSLGLYLLGYVRYLLIFAILPGCLVTSSLSYTFLALYSTFCLCLYLLGYVQYLLFLAIFLGCLVPSSLCYASWLCLIPSSLCYTYFAMFSTFQYWLYIHGYVQYLIVFAILLDILLCYVQNLLVLAYTFTARSGTFQSWLCIVPSKRVPCQCGCAMTCGSGSSSIPNCPPRTCISGMKIRSCLQCDQKKIAKCL